MSVGTTIPLRRPHLGVEEQEAIGRVLMSRWLGAGPVVRQFEARLTELLGCRHALAVITGTVALQLALEAVGLRPGDEVIVPSLSYVSSAQAIVSAGGRPVFCEVEPATMSIDVEDALGRVTSRTRALLPVHYGGEACDMRRLIAEARTRHLWVVEDAAHAFGSRYRGTMIGTLGDLTCFSFDPLKNITCGGGGAIATDSDELAERLHPLRNVGIEADSWSRRDRTLPGPYRVVGPGLRAQMGDLHAAIGLVQLERLELYRRRKQTIVARYDDAFRDLPGLRLVGRRREETLPFSYVVRVLEGRRDGLARHLYERGIETAIEFVPNHCQPFFQTAATPLPTSERLFGEVLSLPLHYELTDEAVDTVVVATRDFFCRGG